jgi:phenylacetate-coenzyme A ligase PaaK-like adenylate-forming protein
MPMRPIAQKLEREGKNLKRDYFPHLKNVLQCNELSVSLMAYYNKVFGVPIVNGGAVSEAMYAGGSCIDEGDVGTFLHMHEDMIFIEVFDPRKEVPVEGLEFGQGVFTNMYFQSMAYVRFRSEDWDRVRWDPCPYCGATHMQMRFMGRISESADVKGRIVTAAEIEDIVYTRPESLFLPIQIIREEPQPQDKLRLRICYHEDRVKEPERYRLEVEELAKRELKVDTSVELITPGEVKSVGGFKFERVKKVKRGE